ncbi:MAG: DUF3159 domain-containing protein [Angustibacter sp.]
MSAAPGGLGLGAVPAGATTVEEVVRHQLAEAVGGVRGSIEAALPTVCFVIAWTVTQQLRLSLVVAAAPVFLTLLARLVQRQTPRYVLGSVFALAIAAAFALRSGRAQDVFLPGIIYSATLLGVSLLSVLTRWPMVGFMLGAVHPEQPFAWRAHAGVVRLCSRLTLVLAGLYAVRVAVMVPLYLADQVALLGVAKIVFGWPLYLLAITMMGVLLLRGRTPLEPVGTALAPSGS